MGFNKLPEVRNLRFSVIGLEKVNEIVRLCSKMSNYMTLKMCLQKYLYDDFPMECINKQKDEYLNITDYPCRIRYSKEVPLSKNDVEDIFKNISTDDDGQINFRFKQRISAIIKSKQLRVDATMV